MGLASQAGSPDLFFILYVLLSMKTYDFFTRHSTNEELINRCSFNYMSYFESPKTVNLVEFFLRVYFCQICHCNLFYLSEMGKTETINIWLGIVD